MFLFRVLQRDYIYVISKTDQENKIWEMFPHASEIQLIQVLDNRDIIRLEI